MEINNNLLIILPIIPHNQSHSRGPRVPAMSHALPARSRDRPAACSSSAAVENRTKPEAHART